MGGVILLLLGAALGASAHRVLARWAAGDRWLMVVAAALGCLAGGALYQTAIGERALDVSVSMVACAALCGLALAVGVAVYDAAEPRGER